MSYIGTPTITVESSGIQSATCTAFPGIDGYLLFQTVSTSNPQILIKYPIPIDVSDISKLLITFDVPKAANRLNYWNYLVDSSGATYKEIYKQIDSAYVAIDKTTLELDCSDVTTQSAYFWQRIQFAFHSGTFTGQLRLYSVIGE